MRRGLSRLVAGIRLPLLLPPKREAPLRAERRGLPGCSWLDLERPRSSAAAAVAGAGAAPAVAGVTAAGAAAVVAAPVCYGWCRLDHHCSPAAIRLLLLQANLDPVGIPLPAVADVALAQAPGLIVQQLVGSLLLRGALGLQVEALEGLLPAQLALAAECALPDLGGSDLHQEGAPPGCCPIGCCSSWCSSCCSSCYSSFCSGCCSSCCSSC